MKELKNKYFLLRHGQTTHQIEDLKTIYFWPDGNPPYSLTELGRQEIKKKATELKDKKIDLIFSSDILRTKQTAEIVAQELGLEPKFDQRLRDTNWGVFQGKSMKQAWAFYNHNMEKKFTIAPSEGESWYDVKTRVIDLLKEIEEKYSQKNILIVSHGDPLWLLEDWINGLNQEQSLERRKNGSPMKMGDLKEIN